MDADFVQSVARVGDEVDVQLMMGPPLSGMIVELALDRMVLQQATGARVVLALPGILTIAQQVPTATTAQPATPETVQADAALPAPAMEPPTRQQGQPSAGPLTEPAAEPAGNALLSDMWLGDVLAGIADLPFDVSFSVTVPAELRPKLLASEQRFSNARRINELAPKFGRVRQVAADLYQLLLADSANGALHHLLGCLSLLEGDPADAKPLFATAADLESDPESWRLLAIAAARSEDPDTIVYALLRYFGTITPVVDPQAWQALVDVLNATGGLEPLGELLRGPLPPRPATKKAIREAWPAAAPAAMALPRPAGALARPVRHRAPVAPKVVASSTVAVPRKAASNGGGAAAKPAVKPTAKTGARPAAKPTTKAGPASDHFVRADVLNKRQRNFDEAEKEYRLEITTGGPKRESAVKDLAWLTKRRRGPEAALRVLEVEFPGVVPAGDSLDNILIDFYSGARRYDDALEVLNRQLKGRNRTSSKVQHLLHQIAYVKFSAGRDSVPDWRDLLAASPANPTVLRGLAMALVQSRTAEALDEAEDLIRDDATAPAEDIRQRIAAVRQGDDSSLGSPKLVDRLFTTDLVLYVLDRYSEQAAEIIKQRQQEKKAVNFRDAQRLADNASHSRGFQRANSAEGYISAAAILREYGAEEHADDDDERLYSWLCSGLTALADMVLEGQQDRQAVAVEAARDLYCEALVVSERLRDPVDGSDAKLALGRFLQSLDRGAALKRRKDTVPDGVSMDKLVAILLRDQYEMYGDAIFPLVAQLVARTEAAAEAALTVIEEDELLRVAAARHLDRHGCAVPAILLSEVAPEGTAEGEGVEVLRSAWGRYGSDWAKEQRHLIDTLVPLRRLTIAEEDIRAALDRLAYIEPEASTDKESLKLVRDALSALRQYLYAESFEQRDTSLRQVGDAMDLVRKRVREAPTNIAVEGIDPIAIQMRSLVEKAQAQLVDERRPLPELSLALAESNQETDGLVTVQVEVRNKEGMAPVESGELWVGSSPDLYMPQEEVLRLPRAVSGGQSLVLRVRLRLSQSGSQAGAFSLPVTLRFRSRSHTGDDEVTASLPVQLADPTTFELIEPNPFEDGATGRPVHDPAMFFGRDELLNKIERRLRNSTVPGTGVAIFGQKRAGKSSIRLRLIDRLSQRRESNNLVVVDMENIGSYGPRPEDGADASRVLLGGLLWEILRTASRELAKEPALADRPPLVTDLIKADLVSSGQPVVDFLNVLQDYFADLDTTPHMVVLIDEFQYFDEWINDGSLSPSFMQAIKAIVERRVFDLVIVGQDAIERIIHEHANVFQVFQRERVSYLDDANAQELIVDPIRIGGRKGTNRYRQHAVDRIVELTGGSPYYIQKFCSALVEQMNENRAPLVTEADVELVRDRLLEQIPEGDFDNLETAGYTGPNAPTKEQYRQVLLAIAIATRDGTATVERVREYYRGTGNLEKLLDDLVIRDVARKESGRLSDRGATVSRLAAPAARWRIEPDGRIVRDVSQSVRRGRPVRRWRSVRGPAGAVGAVAAALAKRPANQSRLTGQPPHGQDQPGASRGVTVRAGRARPGTGVSERVGLRIGHGPVPRVGHTDQGGRRRPVRGHGPGVAWRTGRYRDGGAGFGRLAGPEVVSGAVLQGRAPLRDSGRDRAGRVRPRGRGVPRG